MKSPPDGGSGTGAGPSSYLRTPGNRGQASLRGTRIRAITTHGILIILPTSKNSPPLANDQFSVVKEISSSS
ncbi:MAG: hypothetical protein ACLFN2_05075 [Bacteroidales bacterium]